MKKYKEWLTNLIEIMESETSENYPHEQMVEREVVLSLINQPDEPEVKQIKELESYNDELIRDNNQLRNALDNQEVLSQKWIEEHRKSYTMEDSVEISDLQNLLVPKQEIPVIPKYVAEYLDFAKKEASLIEVLVIVSVGWPTMKKEFSWILANSEIFARAWLDGYVVKEEQKYLVNILDEGIGAYLIYYPKSGNYGITGVLNDSKGITRFTEQEIKDYDERYWLFAVKVEELEE